jgi:hypothetical protein
MASASNGQPVGAVNFTDNLQGNRVFIGTTAPSYPTNGDVWLDADIYNNAGQNLISTATLTGVATKDISVLSLYKNMRIVFRGIQPSADTTVNITVNDDVTHYASGTALYSLANFKSGITTNHMVLDLLDTQDTASFSWGSLNGFYTNASNSIVTLNATSVYTQTNALNKITISVSSGTFTGGTALVYGVN